MTEIKAPWLKNYGDVPFNLEYPEGSISRVVLETASRYPDTVALSFMGKKTSFSSLAKSIDLCARAFRAAGISEGDCVCLCMPSYAVSLSNLGTDFPHLRVMFIV